VHSHSVSAGTFYAVLQFEPEARLAVAVLANVGPAAQPAVEKVAELQRARHRPQR
jgi:hypothetical protein